MQAPERLRRWRKRRKSSQAECAKAAGVSQGTWSAWETGDRTPAATQLVMIEHLTEGEVPVALWASISRADMARIASFLKAS